MRADDAALAEVASSVADGSPVNWNRVEGELPPPQRRLARHLRLVESIAQVHRSMPGGDETVTDLAEPSVGGLRWGRLVLRDRIGEGMSGEVHRALDADLHREVALKLLHEGVRGGGDAHRRVLDEARRLARIRHPHVVHVYGAERHDDRVGLWMELVQGESLEQIVRTRGPFGANEAATIGLDLCSALAAVHAAGLLHRDLKAQNVLREAGGRIVLMDFGTGEELRRNEGSKRMVGTPLYLAPELFRGGAATVRSDIYSLGVLLFYIVTVEFPTIAASMIELGKAHSSGQRRLLRDARPDLPEPFVAVVERALERDPAKRYASAGEMEAALRRALELRPEAPRTYERPRIARWQVFAGLAAALLLLVVGLVVWSLGPAAGPTGPTRRIAVLPLTDESQPPADAHLADALTDELISTLGQIGALRVSSRTSVNRYRSPERSLPEVARHLGVEVIVVGTVALDRAPAGQPDRVHANVRLIAAGSDTPMWSESFERVRGDTFRLQAAIARAIADRIGVRLTREESGRLARATQTSPAAEEDYLRGRVYLGQYGAAAATRALLAFKRAIEADPQHAAANAGAAVAYTALGGYGTLTHQSARASALAHVRTALELDTESAEAHGALADILHWYDWDFAGAEREYQRSLELNPSYARPRNRYAQMLAAVGRFDEAIAQAQHERDLDPQSAAAVTNTALILYYKRDYVAAEQAIRDALALEPNSPAVLLMLGRIEEAQGRLNQAVEDTTRALELSANGGVPLRVGLIRLEVLSGRREQGLARLKAIEDDAARGTARLEARDWAYIYLAFGEREKALAALERALEERAPSLVWLRVDPRFDPIRTDPRFQKILQRVGLS